MIPLPAFEAAPRSQLPHPEGQGLSVMTGVTVD